ncbi:MAG: threonine synthase [Chloroflexota bacterium]|nr:threonine synthase [Chloroflexota bacterium]
MRQRLVERYRAFLPISDATPELTLGEGFTPLMAAPRLGARIGVPRLHLKLEGLNPTVYFMLWVLVLSVL